MVGEAGRGGLQRGLRAGRRAPSPRQRPRAASRRRGGGRSALTAPECSHVTGPSLRYRLRLLRRPLPSTPTNRQKLHIPECHGARIRRVRPSAIRGREEYKPRHAVRFPKQLAGPRTRGLCGSGLVPYPWQPEGEWGRLLVFGGGVSCCGAGWRRTDPSSRSRWDSLSTHFPVTKGGDQQGLYNLVSGSHVRRKIHGSSLAESHMYSVWEITYINN